eukprot:2982319-Rhodomonas_salina.5
MALIATQICAHAPRHRLAEAHSAVAHTQAARQSSSSQSKASLKAGVWMITEEGESEGRGVQGCVRGVCGACSGRVRGVCGACSGR